MASMGWLRLPIRAMHIGVYWSSLVVRHKPTLLSFMLGLSNCCGSIFAKETLGLFLLLRATYLSLIHLLPPHNKTAHWKPRKTVFLQSLEPHIWLDWQSSHTLHFPQHWGQDVQKGPGYFVPFWLIYCPFITMVVIPKLIVVSCPGESLLWRTVNKYTILQHALKYP